MPPHFINLCPDCLQACESSPLLALVSGHPGPPLLWLPEGDHSARGAAVTNTRMQGLLLGRCWQWSSVLIMHDLQANCAMAWIHRHVPWGQWRGGTLERLGVPSHKVKGMRTLVGHQAFHNCKIWGRENLSDLRKRELIQIPKNLISNWEAYCTRKSIIDEGGRDMAMYSPRMPLVWRWTESSATLRYFCVCLVFMARWHTFWELGNITYIASANQNALNGA